MSAPNDLPRLLAAALLVGVLVLFLMARALLGFRR